MSSQKLIIEVKSEFSQCYERLCNLAQRLKHPNPFLRPEWLALWWQFFGRGKSLYLIFSRYNDEDIGYAPFYKVDHPIMGLTEFRLLGDNVASYLDWVCEPGLEEQMVEAVFEHFDQQNNGVIIHLKDINDLFSRFFPFFNKKLECYSNGVKIPLYPCPLIEINMKWEDFIIYQRKSRTRSNLKRKDKMLFKLGKVNYKEINNNEDIVPIYRIIQKIHKERFRNTINPLFRGVHREFWRAALEIMIPDHILLSLIEIDGYPISFIIGFKMGDVFIYYAPAFDPAFSSVSLGQVHLIYLMKRKFNENYRIFDFSKGEADYKRLWATGESQNYLLRFVFNLSKTGFLYEKLLNSRSNIKVFLRKSGISNIIKKKLAQFMGFNNLYKKTINIKEIPDNKYDKSLKLESWSYKSISYLPIEVREAIIKFVLKCDTKNLKIGINNNDREIYLFAGEKSPLYRIKY